MTLFDVRTLPTLVDRFWFSRRRAGSRRGRLLRAWLGLGVGLLAAAPAAAQFTRVSVGLDGAPPNGDSFGSRASISADGRLVAFDSAASNLVLNDTNGATDAFVRDLQAGVTTRVSVATGGGQRPGLKRTIALSATGRFVLFIAEPAFREAGTGGCPPDQTTCADLYVHDRDTQTTTMVSIQPDGTPFEVNTGEQHISADGRFVVFSANIRLTPDTHILLRDLQAGTTTRISPVHEGLSVQFYGNALLSDDGGTVVFRGALAPGVPRPSPEECPICELTTYVYTRATGALSTIPPAFSSIHLERVPMPTEPVRFRGHVPIDVSADGRYVLIVESLEGISPGPTFPFRRSLVYDQQTGRADTSAWSTTRQVQMMSGDGRSLLTTIAAPPFSAATLFTLEDRVSGLVDRIDRTHIPQPGVPQLVSIALSRDARFIAFSSPASMIVTDTDEFSDVYLADRDPDGDGLPSRWETTFGLDPAVAGDAALDADADGLTNVQEHAQGTHPAGTDTRYFAEGVVNEFFSTRFALLNPNDAPVTVVQRFLGSSGATTSALRTLPARSRATIEMEFLGPGGETDFSSVIESDRPIVAERTVHWDENRYGAHAERAIETPSTTWYLAEGATHGRFDLFYLLQNANDVAADVTVTYLRPAPLAPVTRVYAVAPHSRRTIWVDDEGPALAETDVAATITSTQPVIVERAMYFSTTAPFNAGHAGAGVTAPATRWFLAEGATGSFFDLFVLVGNPGTSAANLSVSYLLPSGERFSKTHTVAAQSRLTISVQGEDPRLADTPVSVIVESTNDQPVVVERAMWWPKGDWYEAHLSAGATETGTRWAVAEGQIGADAPVEGEVETYVLIANTSARLGSATVTVIPEGGSAITQSVPLPANSRVNVPVSTLFPAGASRRFGTIVESDGVEIVVERAIYRSTGGLAWSAGTATLATKLAEPD